MATAPQTSHISRYLLALALPLMLLVWKFGSHHLLGDTRAPASAVDLSHLEGQSFVMAAKLNMLEGLAITTRDGLNLVTMGHFNGGESRSSICSAYQRVEYVFAADDSVVSGDPTLMTITGNCVAGSEGTQLRALEVNYTKFLSEKISDRTFIMHDRDDVEVTFSNVGDEWPRAWSLKSARYVGSSPLVIQATDIFNFRGRPFKIIWP